MRHPRGISLSTAIAIACLAATALPTGAVSSAAAGTPAGLADPAPALDWQPCTSESLDGFDCATLERPLDRARPRGAKVQLAVVRLPATGTPEQRIGSLFMNPGGPGGSGLEAAGLGYLLPAEVRQSFDFVTWDPRGIGASTPAITGCDAPMPARPATGTVAWQRILNARIRALSEVNRACYAANRSIIEHAGTVDVAHDLDALRAAVGDEKLTYWGISYGTMLGSTYAQLFPAKVRALVFDGNMDPQTTFAALSGGSTAPDHSIRFFLNANPQLRDPLTRVLRELDKRTLSLPDGTAYTRWDLLDVVAGNVSFLAWWPKVEAAIEASDTALFGSGDDRQKALQALTDPALRSPATDSNAGVFSAILCQDFADRPTRDQMRAPLNQAVREGPLYGGTLAVDYLASCSGYAEARPDPVPRPKRYGPNVPGLITNGTHDGATPYQWAVNMSRVYRGMRMVTIASGSHGVFILAESPCVNGIVSDYLVSGDVPPLDQACPFSPPAPT